MEIKKDVQGLFQATNFHLFRVRQGSRTDDLLQKFATSRDQWVALGGTAGMDPERQATFASEIIANGVVRVANQVAGQAVTQHSYEPNFNIIAALKAASNLGTEQKVTVLDMVSETLIANIAGLHEQIKAGKKEAGAYDRIQVMTAAIVALHTDSPLAQKLAEDTKQLGIKADQGTGATERNLFRRIVANLEPMASALGTYLSTPEVTGDHVADVMWLKKAAPQGLFAAKMLGYANTALQQRLVVNGVPNPKDGERFLQSYAVANEFHRLFEASGEQHVWELVMRMMQINPRLAATFAGLVDPSLVENRMVLKAIAQGVPLSGSQYDKENDLYRFARTGAIDFSSVVHMRLAGGQFANIPAMLTDFFCGRDNFEKLVGHTTSARARWILRGMYEEGGKLFYPPLAADETTLARVAADTHVDRTLSSNGALDQVKLAESLSMVTRHRDYTGQMVLPERRQANIRYVNDAIAEQGQVAGVFAQASRLFLADRLNSLRDHLGESDSLEAKKGSYYGATMIMVALSLQEGMFPNPKAVEGLYGEFTDTLIDVITGEKAASAQVKRAAEFTLQALVPLFPESQVLALIDRYEQRVLENPAMLGSFGQFSHALAIHTDSTLPEVKNERNGVRPAVAERMRKLTLYLVENYRSLTGYGIVDTVLTDPSYVPSGKAALIPPVRIAGGALNHASPLVQAELFARELQRREYVGKPFEELRAVISGKIEPELKQKLFYRLTIDGLRPKIEQRARAMEMAKGIDPTVRELRGLVDMVFPFMGDVPDPSIGGLTQELIKAYTEAGVAQMLPEMPTELTDAVRDAGRSITTWEERMQQLEHMPTAEGRYNVIFEGVRGMLDAIYAHLPQTHVSGGGLGRSAAILNFPQPGEYTKLVEELLKSGSVETRAFIEYLTQTGELDIQKVQNGIAVVALEILKKKVGGAVDINEAIVGARVTMAGEQIEAIDQVIELFKRSRNAKVRLTESSVRLFEARANKRKLEIEADVAAMEAEWRSQLAHTNKLREGALATVRSADAAARTQRDTILRQIDEAVSPEGAYAQARDEVLSRLNNPDLVGDMRTAVIAWIRNPSSTELVSAVGHTIGVNLTTMELI